MSKSADVKRVYHQSDRLQGYADALTFVVPSQSEKTFQKIADNFEDDLLEFENFPTEDFDFILDLLSNETFYSKPGLWNFLMVLSTENHKLKAHHYERLATTIEEHYPSYVDGDLCLAVCDFIARNFPQDQARKVLNRLKEMESGKAKDLKRFADEGLWILEREVSRSTKKIE